MYVAYYMHQRISSNCTTNGVYNLKKKYQTDIRQKRISPPL